MFRLRTQDFIPNVRVDIDKKELLVQSKFHLYGSKASELLFPFFEYNIKEQWGAKPWVVDYNDAKYILLFQSEVLYTPLLTEDEVKTNVDLRNVYICVEDYSRLHISSVDGRGSNTGYFLYANLIQKGSTTIAHEYGHMLGLWPLTQSGHPLDLDQRGKGMPGIMYPRGTWVDPQYQYDPAIEPGQKGGTIDPQYRQVNENDIRVLMGELTRHNEKSAVLGRLTNRYHHGDVPPERV